MTSIDDQWLLELAAALVRIDSVNPSLVPGGRGESEVAAYVAQRLDDLGLETRVLESEAGRPSVVGILRGSGGGRSLMLNAHFDTVGVEGMARPFSGEIRGGRLYGRGAYDMKGSLASCLGAVRAIRDSGRQLAGDVVIAAVADEEHASLGTQEVLRHLRTDAAVVTEPTDLQVCLAHKGFVWWEIETFGRAAHGSRPDLGEDANLRMGRVLAEIDRLSQDLSAVAGHPLLGPASLHAATLEGGSGWSTYAAGCRLQVERRTLPGETPEGLRQEMQELLDRLARRDASFRSSLRLVLARQPFEVDPQARIVRDLEASLETAGRGARQIGEGPWMDSALLAEAGVETVVFGPAGGGAHGDEEWVDTQSLIDLAELLARTAERYCSRPRDA